MNPRKPTVNPCPHCCRNFSTPQGLGLHFHWGCPQKPKEKKRRCSGAHSPETKFKCRWCRRQTCGACEGTHDPKDPIGNELCDPCWARRQRKLGAEGSQTMTREEFVDRWSQGFPGLAEEPFEFVRALDALLDAERAQAREEQREADARCLEGLHRTAAGNCNDAFERMRQEGRTTGDSVGTACGNCSRADMVRATPLTATPLADRIAELERERDEVRAALLSSAHAQREACAKMVGAHMRLPIAPEAEMLVRSTPLVTPRSPYESRPTLDNGGR